MVRVSFATNGDNLIGVTPISRGMGGIGVGMPIGPIDSVFRNPAWKIHLPLKQAMLIFLSFLKLDW